MTHLLQIGLKESVEQPWEGWRALARQKTWKTAPRRIESGARELSGTAEAVDWSEATAWLEERDTLSAEVPTGRPLADASPILAFKTMAGAAARSIGASATVAPTLAAASGGNQVPGIVYAVDMRHVTVGDTSMTIQVGPAGGWSLNATPCALHEVGKEWIVRRFTPLECIRLQGLDDDWLDGVRLGGRPLTDADRYRLVGNA